MSQNRFDITREQYHQFTRGTKRTMDPELGNFLVGFGTMCWGVFACAGTMYLMRPDDFSWVDEEREKAAAAAERYKRIAEKTGVQLVDNSPTPLLPMLQVFNCFKIFNFSTRKRFKFDENVLFS